MGSLYVAEEARLVGLVSRKDLLKSAITGSDTRSVPIATIMTRMPNILTLQKNDSVIDAANMLVTHEIDSLPVIKSDNQVIGKISKSHIVTLFVDTMKKT
ncbi:hypothetical protein MCOL2_07726 [Listeria fleischmannii FSL S10-1203]|uniref:CBS domain-containing protein n=1 Tax=Listeria fleischmannii FSL S10-1203 TaxID=1265822 RepID=W7DFM3_9LIST|nr:hypothetical protein MCOL2_07726 [Listeria fleischmannii FSL S10-1203]